MINRHTTFFVKDLKPIEFCGKPVMWQMDINGYMNGCLRVFVGVFMGMLICQCVFDPAIFGKSDLLNGYKQIY